MNHSTSSLTKNELPSLTAEEIRKLVLVNDGYVVINKTTGCINFFYQHHWYEVCGKCIPQFDKPQITAIQEFASGNDITFKDTARYRAMLLPDSVESISSDRRIFIKKPVSFSESKKYVLQVSNLNDACENRLVLETVLQFNPAFVPTSITDKDNHSYTVLPVASHSWLAEPLATDLNNKEMSISYNGSVYYNWSALNRDPFNSKQPTMAISKRICPKGFTIPSVEEAEELIARNQKEYVANKFQLGKEAYVLPKATKKGESTDNRFIFMLKDSNQPEGFQTLLIDNGDIRIATMPREVYVRVLCVSE